MGYFYYPFAKLGVPFDVLYRIRVISYRIALVLRSQEKEKI